MIRKPLRSIIRLSAIVLLAVTVSSCVTKVPVSQDFWQHKKARVAVAISTGESHGHFFKEGNQGLLDIVINSAMTSAPEKALFDLKPDVFRKAKGSFIAELKKRGFDTVEVKNDLNFKDYPKFKGGDAYISSKDYSSLLSRYRADYLIVLSLNGYGAIRPYYGFIPLGGPAGYSNTSGFMVKSGETKPVWNTGLSINNAARSDVQGEWDKPPEFKNLVSAANRAIEVSRTSLFTDFFN